MAGRNNQVSRIYKILTLLEAHHFGLSVSELWERLEAQGINVGERTIYRDLEALKLAGFPLLEKSKSDDGAVRWVLDTETKLGELFTMTPREVLALYLARRALKPLQNMPFQEDLEGLFFKIEDRLGARNELYYKELQNDIQFAERSALASSIHPETFETVQAACAENQILKTIYKSASGQTERARRIGPHYLYFAKDTFYLVGEDLEDCKVKVFALTRMSETQMLDESYSGEKTSPGKTFEGSLGVFQAQGGVRVRVVFLSPIASYVAERVWHPSQTRVQKETATSEADFAVELCWTLGITPELVQWLMSFGKYATVLEPVELKNLIKAEALAVAQKY